MRYLIKFSYDGSNYAGYQIQPKLNTIQGKLEDAICKINNGKRKTVQASGRTDKGVHAICQYAHVDLDISITEKKLKKALNTYLPDDIHVIKTSIVDDNFHARYDVKSKEYKYILNMGEYNPFDRNYVFQYNYKLNVENIRKSISVFEGKHDFRAFVSENKNKKDCVRVIEKAIVEQENKKLVFTFKGNGFMKYQIRNMVGSLIKVGEGKMDKEGLKNILDSCDRTKGGVTAPSNGLYLVDVSYKQQ